MCSPSRSNRASRPGLSPSVMGGGPGVGVSPARRTYTVSPNFGLTVGGVAGPFGAGGRCAGREVGVRRTGLLVGVQNLDSWLAGLGAEAVGELVEQGQGLEEDLPVVDEQAALEGRADGAGMDEEG